MKQLIGWMKKNIEMTLTIISGILIVVGFILDVQNQQAAVPTFIIAFIIGGYYSFLNAYHILVKERKLSVDVLMILAAIGASIHRLLDGRCPAHFYFLIG